MVQDNGPVAPYLEAMLDLDLFIEIVMHGFGFGSTAEFWTDFERRSAKRSKKDDPILNDDYYAKKKDRAKRLAEYAQEQSETEFSYVYQISSIQLWSLVEACIDDLVVLLLQDEKSLENSELLHKLKGALIPFTRASKEEQVEIIKHQLIQELAAPLKPGIARYESLLSTLGLSGPAPASVRKALLELAEVRNVIIHKNARADVRIIETCPWLGLTHGQTLILKHEDFQLYSVASSHYLVSVGERWRSRYPEQCTDWEDTPEDMAGLLTHLIGIIDSIWEKRATKSA
jgi:hypothetical protein